MPGIFSNYKFLKRRLDNLYWRKHSNWYVTFKKYPDEEFKEIVDFYGLYFISNYGQVISFNRRLPLVRKYKFISGRFALELSRLGRTELHYIHDLVYSHFVAPLKPNQVVTHKNGISTDNYYKNLRLTKVKKRYSKKKKRFDFSLLYKIEEESTTRAAITVPTLQFDREGNLLKEFPSMKAASIATGIDSQFIRACANGKKKTAKGYQWKRKNDPIDFIGPNKIAPVTARLIPRARAILQFDLQGHFIKKYKSLSNASRSTGAKYTGISTCAAGRYKTAGGFQWRYQSDPQFKQGISDIAPVKILLPGSTKPIIQFDLQGKFVAEYYSIKEACRKTGIRDQYLNICLKKRCKSTGGYQWRYKAEMPENISPEDLTIEPVKRPCENFYKPVLQFSLRGKFKKEFPSINEVARKTGISKSKITRCLRGKRPTAGGFQWKFKNDPLFSRGVVNIPPVKAPRYNKYHIPSKTVAKEILQFDLKGCFIKKYQSIKQAARELKIYDSNINLCLNGKTKKTGGYQWRWADDPLFKNGIKDIGPFKPQSYPTSKSVLQYDLEGNLVGEYRSINHASLTSGISRTYIYRCVRGQYKVARGFIWKLKS